MVNMEGLCSARYTLVQSSISRVTRHLTAFVSPKPKLKRRALCCCQGLAPSRKEEMHKLEISCGSIDAMDANMMCLVMALILATSDEYRRDSKA